MSKRRRALRGGRSARLILIYAPLIVCAALFINSYAYFGRLVLTKDWNAQPATLPVAIALASTYDGLKVMANTLAVAFDAAPMPQASPLPAVHLRVEDGSLETMTADLPHSAKAKYYKARLLYPDGVWRKINYRLRGRGHWHWDKAKPSLRLKLPKSAPLDLQRHINLVNPEDRPMVANPLGEELARRLGLLTHRTDFTRLFINGQFRGVYHQTTREDESLLRLRRRLPGPIFEAYDLKPRWRAADFRLRGDTAVLKHANPLQSMIEAIYRPNDPARFATLWGALSFEKYARFAALMSLVSGTHADAFHNHLFYFDPAAGLIEPWVTDINGHGMLLYPSGPDRFHGPPQADTRVPLNELITPLRDAALRDPRLAHRRNVLLYEALNGHGSVIAQGRILAGYFQRINADARADRRKGALDRDYLEPYRLPFANRQYAAAKRDLYEWIKGRNAFLLSALENTSVSLRIAARGTDGRRLVEVTVDGHAAVRFDPSLLGGPVLSDRKFGGRPTSRIAKPILLHPGLREITGNLRRSLRVFRRVPEHALVPGPQRYLLAVPANTVDHLIDAFRNAVTDKPVRPTVTNIARLDADSIIYTNQSVHAWRFPPETADDLVLGPGRLALTQNLVTLPGQTLRIAAGTTVKLAAGVSIIAKGPLHVDGHADRPVVIKRADPGKAWGVLAIQGPAAENSIIRHARIRGGSTARHGHVMYSGMVSVHHADGLVIADSTLAENEAGDDSLHLVNATFDIRRVTLHDCFADCIDLDYANGTISGLDVDQAGNDGIDFMDSRVTATQLTIHHVGDKGLSVGERSRVDLRTARISAAPIAIAVKDASRATLKEVTLRDNDIGIDLAAKNWRYGGPGSARVRDTVFDANHLDLRTTVGSRAEFIGQAVPATREGAGHVIEFAADRP